MRGKILSSQRMGKMNGGRVSYVISGLRKTKSRKKDQDLVENYLVFQE